MPLRLFGCLGLSRGPVDDYGDQERGKTGVNGAVTPQPARPPESASLGRPAAQGPETQATFGSAALEPSKRSGQQREGAVASVFCTRQALTSVRSPLDSAATQTLASATSSLAAAVPVTAGEWKRSACGGRDPAESCNTGIRLDEGSTEPFGALQLAAGRSRGASQRASSTSGHVSALCPADLSSEVGSTVKCGPGSAKPSQIHAHISGIAGLVRAAAGIPSATVVDAAQMAAAADGGGGGGSAPNGFASSAGPRLQAAADASLAGMGIMSGPAGTPGAGEGKGRVALPVDLRSSPLPHRACSRAYAALAAGAGPACTDSGRGSSEHPCCATQHPPSAGGATTATTMTHTAMGFGSSLQSGCSSLGLNQASIETNNASVSGGAQAQLSRHLSGMEAAAAAAAGGSKPARAGSTLGNSSFMMDLDMSSSIARIRTSVAASGSAGAAEPGVAKAGHTSATLTQSPLATLMAHHLGSSGGTAGTPAGGGLATANATHMCTLTFTPTATGTCTTTANANMLTDASASSGGQPPANATAAWLASPRPPQQQPQTPPAPPSPPAQQQALLQQLRPQLSLPHDSGRNSNKSPPRPSMDMGFIRATTLTELSEQLEGLRWLASGSSGRVYTGLWKGSPVAVKIVVSHTPDQMRDNAREALLSRVVSHPCVTQCYTVCFDVVTGEHLRLPEPPHGARHSPAISCTFQPADVPSSHSTVLLSSGRPGSVGAVRGPGAPGGPGGPLISSASLHAPCSLNTSGGGINSLGLGMTALPHKSPNDLRIKRQPRALVNAAVAMAAAMGGHRGAPGISTAQEEEEEEELHTKFGGGAAGCPHAVAGLPGPRIFLVGSPGRASSASPAAPAGGRGVLHLRLLSGAAQAAADTAGGTPASLSVADCEGSSAAALVSESGGSGTRRQYAVDPAVSGQLASAAAEQERLQGGKVPVEGVSDESPPAGAAGGAAEARPLPQSTPQTPLYRSRLQQPATSIGGSPTAGGAAGGGVAAGARMRSIATHSVNASRAPGSSQACPISGGGSTGYYSVGLAAHALMHLPYGTASPPPFGAANSVGGVHGPASGSGGGNAAFSSDSQYGSFPGLHAALAAAAGANILSLNSSGMNREMRRAGGAGGAGGGGVFLGASGAAHSSYGAPATGAGGVGYGGEINTTLSLSELLRTCGGACEDDSNGLGAATSLAGVLAAMGTVPGRYCTAVVLEWCSQGTLLQAIRSHPFNPERSPANTDGLLALLRTALEVAQGMRYLHSLDIIHGDLKPSNVLLQSHVTMPDSAGRWASDSRGYVAKVADFGLAVPAAASGSTGSALGLGGAKGPADGGIGSSCAWGALAYLAPEVPERGPSKKSDVWSYGCVLYHMCTGRQPFQGIRQGRLLLGLATGELKLEWPDHVYKLLRRLGEACCARDPRERPSFDRVVTALQKIIKHVASGGVGGAGGGGARMGSQADHSLQLGGTGSGRTTGDGMSATPSTRANSNAAALGFASVLGPAAPLPSANPSGANPPSTSPVAASTAPEAAAVAAGEVGSPAAAASNVATRRAGPASSIPPSGSSGLAARELNPEAARAAQEWRAALAGCAQLGGAGLFVAGAPAAPNDYGSR